MLFAKNPFMAMNAALSVWSGKGKGVAGHLWSDVVGSGSVLLTKYNIFDIINYLI